MCMKLSIFFHYMIYALNNSDINSACGNPRIINLSDASIEESVYKASSHQSRKVQIRGRVTQWIFSAIEHGQKITLKLIQKTTRWVNYALGSLDDVIEDKIGDWSDVLPDFTPEYEKQDILVMAVLYGSTRKRTIEAIREFFSVNWWYLSKRQAIKIKDEIDNRYPTLPGSTKIWELN